MKRVMPNKAIGKIITRKFGIKSIVNLKKIAIESPLVMINSMNRKDWDSQTMTNKTVVIKIKPMISCLMIYLFISFMVRILNLFDFS